MRVYLQPAGVRPISTADFSRLWRARLGDVAGLQTAQFQSDAGGPSSGKSLTVDLSARDTATLNAAAQALAAKLKGFQGVHDIDSGVAEGKPQLSFTLNDTGRALGLTNAMVGRQVRAAFYGDEALRELRGSNEVRGDGDAAGSRARQPGRGPEPADPIAAGHLCAAQADRCDRAQQGVQRDRAPQRPAQHRSQRGCHPTAGHQPDHPDPQHPGAARAQAPISGSEHRLQRRTTRPGRIHALDHDRFSGVDGLDLYPAGDPVSQLYPADHRHDRDPFRRRGGDHRPSDHGLFAVHGQHVRRGRAGRRGGQ